MPDTPTSSSQELTRRTFLKTVTGSAVGASLLGGLSASASVSPHTTPSSKIIKVGVVGGNFGLSFFWHLHPNSKVTAVCDLRPDRLAEMAKTYQCGNTYKDFRTMLREADMDAVAVFTPAPLHVWMATEAMKAGKHVISAVPAGMSLEELAQLIECKEKTGMTYMMAETSFFRPQIHTSPEGAPQGRFGTNFYSEAEYHHEGLIPLMYDEKGCPPGATACRRCTTRRTVLVSSSPSSTNG
jgi:hypothetical protein